MGHYAVKCLPNNPSRALVTPSEDGAGTIAWQLMILASAPAIAELLAPELGWDEAEIARQVDAYLALCDAELEAAIRTDPRHAEAT